MSTTSGTKRDVRIRLESTWEGAGFELATRAVSRYETDYRRMAQMQMRAEQEMAAAAQKRAADIEAANKRQMLAMEGAGKFILGMAAASAAGLVLATNAAMDWESAWAGVKKTVDGTPEQMASLESQLRQLATTLPSTHDEIAAVAEAAGQLGIAREDIAAFTKTAIDLGNTTDLSADQAATSLAQLMNIMKTAPDQIDELGSTLVALGNDGASTESQILSMALRLAGAGELIGATEGEILATASALSSMGVSAEAGGGATSRVLQKLYSAMSEGGEKVAAFAEVAGMSADEFATAWRDDPITALASFADGLNGVEASGGNVIQTLRDLGIRSSEEQRIILQLKANADLLTDSLDLQSQAWDANTALVDEANQRYATTEAKLQLARNQINDAAIDLGANFLPVVADTAEWVGQLATGFGTLPDPLKKFASQLGAGATGLGLVVGGAALVIPKLQRLSETVANLRGGTSLLARGLGGTAGVLAGPWGIAIAAATAGLAIYLQKQGEAKQRIAELTSTIDENSGAWTDNSREVAFAALEASGAIDRAKAAGLDLNDFVTASLDPTSEAFVRITDHAAGLREELGNLDPNSDSANQIQAIKNESEAYSQILVDLGSQQDTAAAAQQQLADRQAAGVSTAEDVADATDDAATAQEDFGAAAELAAEDAEALNAELDKMIDALETLNEPTLNARDAARQWEASLDAVTAALDENGTTLDITTEAGRNNQEVLDGLARDAMALASAILEETGSEEEFRTSLGKSRQALYEQARRFGMSEDAAWDYVDSVLAIPEKVDTYVELNTSQATTALRTWLNQNTGKRISVYYDAYQGNTYDFDAGNKYNTNAQARGSVMEFFASGGMRNLTPMASVAQVVPANTWRVVGDRGDVPESYIPHDGSARSYAILEETMRRFGITPAAAATGAPVGASSTAGRSVDIDINMAVPPGYAEQVADVTAQRIKTSLSDAMAAAGVGGGDGL